MLMVSGFNRFGLMFLLMEMLVFMLLFRFGLFGGLIREVSYFFFVFMKLFFIVIL